MDKDMLTEVGIPVKGPVNGDGPVVAGSFPAGSYAEVVYTGDYKNLRDAHMEPESWAQKNNLREKRQRDSKGDEWGTTTEIYITDPAQESDPGKWKTAIIVQVANESRV